MRRELVEIRKAGKALERALAELRGTVAAVVEWEVGAGLTLRRRGSAEGPKTNQPSSRAATSPARKRRGGGRGQGSANNHGPAEGSAASKSAPVAEPALQSLEVPVALAAAVADVSFSTPDSAASTLTLSEPNSSAVDPAALIPTSETGH